MGDVNFKASMKRRAMRLRGDIGDHGDDGDSPLSPRSPLSPKSPTLVPQFSAEIKKVWIGCQIDHLALPKYDKEGK